MDRQRFGILSPQLPPFSHLKGIVALPRVLRSGRIFRVWQKTNWGWEFEALFQFNGGKIHYNVYRWANPEWDPAFQAFQLPKLELHHLDKLGIPGVMPSKKKQLNIQCSVHNSHGFPRFNMTPQKKVDFLIFWNPWGSYSWDPSNAKIASLGWVGELFFFIQTFWRLRQWTHILGGDERTTLTWDHVMSVLFVFVNPRD